MSPAESDGSETEPEPLPETAAMEDGSGTSGPQQSQILEGLPEGARVTAQAGWTQETGLDDKGDPLPPPLEVAVDIAGGATANTAAYGMYQIDKITTGGGQTLTLEKPRLWQGPTKTYMRRVSGDFFAGHPDDGVRALFKFDPPAQPVQNITEFAGSVKLRIPKEQKQVIIKNIGSRVGKTIDHTDLKAAGVQFKLVKETGFMALKVMKGDVSKIGAVVPVEKDGTPIPGYSFIPTESSKDNKQQFQWLPQDDMPKDMGLQITLLSGVQEQTIPFRFTNIGVPMRGEAVAQAKSEPRQVARSATTGSTGGKSGKVEFQVTSDELWEDVNKSDSSWRKKYDKPFAVTGVAKAPSVTKRER